MYLEQLAMGCSGLSTEVAEICKEVGLENINEMTINNKEIQDDINYHNYGDMKEEMERYRKLEEVKHGDFTKLPEHT